jgi:nucleotide-binding universal stress UspA family protein
LLEVDAIMRILMCTDGSRHASKALRFGALIAKGAQQQVTVLGVVEHAGEERKVTRMVERVSNALCEQVPQVGTLIRHGHAAEEILKETEENAYDLVVVGSRGRRGITRFVLGSTAARLARYCPVSVLIVKGEIRGLDKILVCTGGAEAGERDTEMAGRIASLSGASVTILHVMSQLPIDPECELDDLECASDSLLATNAREAVHLRTDLKILSALHVPATAKVRQGLVVDGILAEAREGDYDLIVTGAHVATGLQRFILQNTTEEILLGAERPVLVVK